MSVPVLLLQKKLHEVHPLQDVQRKEISVFDIHYHCGNKHYSEHFEIAVGNYGKLVKPRLVDKEYHAISYPLQEISERLM